MICKIENNTSEIKSKEFLGTESITEFHIPKSVEKIGDSAFSVYTDMIPQLISFTVDKDNLCFDVIDGVLVTKDRKKLVAFPLARKGCYTVPEEIEVIGRYAFRMAIFLEEIIMPQSVKVIEKDAFYYCTDLKKVSGVDNLISIGKKAFMKCIKLEQIILPDTVKTIGEQAFYGCDKARFDFGKGISEIGNKAFVGKNISVSLSKEQEKLLSEEIFAMNDKRKFSVEVIFKDKQTAPIVLNGKIGASNILLKNDEFDFNAFNSLNLKEKSVRKSVAKSIKPVLINTISGRAYRFPHEIRYNAFGVDDIGISNSLNYAFSSLATVDENGFTKCSLKKINKEILYTLESDVLKTGINLNFIPSYWNVCPYVYLDDNGNILLDLSYSRQAVVFDEKGVGINKDYQIIHQLWKVSSDFKSAEKINDKASADWKYVNKQAEFVKAEHDKAKNFIREKGSVSKNQDDMQKHFKIKYKEFYSSR